MRTVKQKIQEFEDKYGLKFNEFEQLAIKNPQDEEMFNDYIEWKYLNEIKNE